MYKNMIVNDEQFEKFNAQDKVISRELVHEAGEELTEGMPVIVRLEVECNGGYDFYNGYLTDVDERHYCISAEVKIKGQMVTVVMTGDGVRYGYFGNTYKDLPIFEEMTFRGDRHKVLLGNI